MRRIPKSDVWRAVCISDLHLDAITAGFPRFADIEKNVQRAVDRAKELRASLFFLGDLSDPDPVSVHRCVERMAMWCEEMSSEGLRTVLVAGNHDVVEDGSGSSTLSPILGAFGDARLVTVANGPISLALGPVTLVCLPYPSRARAYDADAFVRALANDGPTIVAGHLMVQGSETGSETSDMPRGRDVAFPLDACVDLASRLGTRRSLFLNGHYHRGQRIPYGEIEVVVPSAPERMTFGEIDHKPSYLVVEWDGERLQWSREFFECRPMYDVLEDHSYWDGPLTTQIWGHTGPFAEIVGSLVKVRAPAGVDAKLVENLRELYAKKAAAFSLSVARETSRKTEKAALALPRVDQSPRSAALALAREHEQGGEPLVSLVSDILDSVGVP
jgi:DNA repair exonuclease SbcCD nuclease subunit